MNWGGNCVRVFGRDFFYSCLCLIKFWDDVYMFVLGKIVRKKKCVV